MAVPATSSSQVVIPVEASLIGNPIDVARNRQAPGDYVDPPERGPIARVQAPSYVLKITFVYFIQIAVTLVIVSLLDGM